MSYNNITPFWLYAMPNPDAPVEKRIKYLETLAQKDGMPEHVRLRLLSEIKPVQRD